MFQRMQSRPAQLALLILVWAILCLPNLGIPALWEVDEGNNAEAGQEMYESGDWVVPTFNYDLRDDKPALLYWLQMACYALVGVNELGARLPSALAALGAILVTWELGRRLFNAAVGLLGGLILASSVSFAVAAHFANPDALLTLFTLLALSCFWKDYRNPGPFRYIGAGIAMGLAVLTKGPIGLLLPVCVVFLFLLWQRQLRRLLDPRQVWACLAFLATAAPWYVWVAVETKGVWVKGFWEKHNLGRGLRAMEGHGGPFYLYLGFLLVGFGLWSIFLGLTIYHAVCKPRDSKTQPDPRSSALDPRRSMLDPRPTPWPWPHIPAEVRFLLCWIVFVLGFFSLSATKLPNYILPLYPALSLLTARMLVDWVGGRFVVKPSNMYGGMIALGAIGVVLAGGIGVVSGLGDLKALHGRHVPQPGAAGAPGRHPRAGRRPGKLAAVAWPAPGHGGRVRRDTRRFAGFVGRLGSSRGERDPGAAIAAARIAG